MEKFIKGEIVVVPFPFSDLSNSKRRPALVLADLSGNDIILCQITSKNTRDDLAISIDYQDLIHGSLSVASNIRPNKIFTADKNIIAYKLGKVSPNKFGEVIEVVHNLITH